MSTFCIKRLIFSLYALSYLAVNFTAYLTDKYYHEHVADIFNRLEYGVNLIGTERWNRPCRESLCHRDTPLFLCFPRPHTDKPRLHRWSHFETQESILTKGNTKH